MNTFYALGKTRVTLTDVAIEDTLKATRDEERPEASRQPIIDHAESKAERPEQKNRPASKIIGSPAPLYDCKCFGNKERRFL
jgi:hypothetical protein